MATHRLKRHLSNGVTLPQLGMTQLQLAKALSKLGKTPSSSLNYQLADDAYQTAISNRDRLDEHLIELCIKFHAQNLLGYEEEMDWADNSGGLERWHGDEDCEEMDGILSCSPAFWTWRDKDEDEDD